MKTENTFEMFSSDWKLSSMAKLKKNKVLGPTIPLKSNFTALSHRSFCTFLSFFFCLFLSSSLIVNTKKQLSSTFFFFFLFPPFLFAILITIFFFLFFLLYRSFSWWVYGLRSVGLWVLWFVFAISFTLLKNMWVLYVILVLVMALSFCWA